MRSVAGRDKFGEVDSVVRRSLKWWVGKWGEERRGKGNGGVRGVGEE